jgi:hypothetical protein
MFCKRPYLKLVILNNTATFLHTTSMIRVLSYSDVISLVCFPLRYDDVVTVDC